MSFDGMHVLVVDDNQGNRKLLEELLGLLGVHSVEMAGNGVEGLAAVERRRPDLVLLDVMMPEMDGYEMCRRLRDAYRRTELPVIFVTALGTAEERAACFAAGGTDVVSKPFNVQEMWARVGVHLENRRLLAGLTAYQDRVREELAAARSAQMTLQPGTEALAAVRRRTGLDVSGVIKTSSELGGDYWSVFQSTAGRLGVLIVDFAGHGVAAACNVFRLDAIMSRLPHRNWQPANLLQFLNNELKALLRPGQFAAALAFVVDIPAGQLALAGALSPMPILVVDGVPRFLEVSGPPLGAFADAAYEQEAVSLPPGAALFAYSDALLESQVDGVPVADQDTVLAWIGEAAPAGCLAAAVLAQFERRVPGEPPDDLTLVCVRRPAG